MKKMTPICGAFIAVVSVAQTALPPVPAPMNVPKPGPRTDAPYAPQPILPGGIVIPLYPPDSPYLNKERIREPEQYNMSQAVPGRISSIVNIHNPSIEVHTVERGINTGTAVILAAGGGHNTLNVGSEAADFVPFFANYGVNTVILRNRLRRDGYNPQTDEVRDALEAIRLVRGYAKEFNLDPHKIGIMGFSAGAELAAAAAVQYDQASRPDFVGLIYPGPSPFAHGRVAPPIPRDPPPAFIVCAGTGDRVHAVWAIEYYRAMLDAGVPNIEMYLYGRGRHPGDTLHDGSRMSGGLTDRNGMPFGTWQLRFVDWFRDLGFLDQPGVETRAAKDLTTYTDTEKSTASSSPGTVEIRGDVSTPLHLTAADVAALPHETIKLGDAHDQASYGGVLLRDILQKAGVPFGAQLRGKALSTYVLAKARDGYEVVFSLGELDPDFGNANVILADTESGKPLDDKHGPLRIVVAGDKHAARSVRMVDEIDVVRLAK